ncbi:MAG: BrnT family toxin [Desulfuromonadales bacterium]|nr:BrnT family toxin [Desulfuromonadales bacterium]
MGLHDFFEYDGRKAWINLKKHRVSFEEALTVFIDPLSITIPDPLHCDEEERRIIIGQSVKRRLLVVVHVDREEKIRIISARKATVHERKKYEEAG